MRGGWWLVAGCWVWTGCTGVTERNRPNVILVMADDMGYECLGANGGLSYQTPELNSLAENGIRFTECHAQPLCTPSRVKLMTGLYNSRNYEKFGYLNPNQATIGTIMKEAGYATCIAGKWQLNGTSGRLRAEGWNDTTRPRHFGFDEYCLWQLTRTPAEGERYAAPLIECNGERWNPDPDAYGPDLFCRFVTDFIGKNREKPFFIYYPMVLVHDPFVPTPDSKTWGDQDSRYRRDPSHFADMVAYTDRIIGRIRTTLDSLGLLKNTILIFTGDNGTNQSITSETVDGPVRGGKGLTINAGTHVPLIISWPARIRRGTVFDGLTDFTDVAPTLADIAGLPFEGDGISFFPLLTGHRQSEREVMLMHYDPRWLNLPKKVFARDKEYKLYDDGRFYHLMTDPLEEHPLETASLTAGQQAIRLSLGEEVSRIRIDPRLRHLDQSPVSLLPYPLQVRWTGKKVRGGSIRLSSESEVSGPIRKELGSILSAQDFKADIEPVINIRMQLLNDLLPEEYRLSVTDGEIRIGASGEAGFFHALQTLRQLLGRDNGGMVLPGCDIRDRPWKAVRGFMLDVGRNFQPLEALRDLVEFMSRYKMNTFHWHLTDRPAWRIESRIFPQLNDPENHRPTRDPGMFYTYGEIRDFMEYARSRQVMVLPEIDMPGHSDAFRTAMGFPMESEEGMNALERILEEFFSEIPADLCPSIHLGSDEVRIPDPEGFISRMVRTCHEHGRRVVIWNPGLPAGADVVRQTWQSRHLEQGWYEEIDSWDSYINNLEPMNSVPRILFKPIGADSPNLVTGSILCLWPDVNLDDPGDAFRQNPVYPALMTHAWSCWTGGVSNPGTTTCTQLPPDSSEAFRYLQDYEKILMDIRQRFHPDIPFPYVPQGVLTWTLTGPFGSRDSTYAVTARGNTLVIRDRFKEGGYFPGILPGEYVTAETVIRSGRKRDLPAWIGFETPLRANRVYGGIPEAGKWDAWGGEILVNGDPLPAPGWENPGWKPSRISGWGSAADQEVPWRVEELWWTRPPVKIPLRKGENHIRVKIPYGSDYQNCMFTFTVLDSFLDPPGRATD